jgi:hypothetical protein
VHEAYVRLVAGSLPESQGPVHFFAWPRASCVLENAVSFSPARARHIERLDDALTALVALDERKAKLIELRYFGGLGPREIGQSLNISGATVAREQRSAEMAAPRDGSRRR